jgi:hypothetical protein
VAPQPEEDDVQLNDDEEDEYDPEDESDDNFIVDDDEEVMEEMQHKQKRGAKKDKKRPKTNTNDIEVDQEDLDLINENRAKHRRLRQNTINDESSDGVVKPLKPVEKPTRKVIRALDEEEEAEEPLEEPSEEKIEEQRAKVMSPEDKLAFDEVFGDPKDILIAETDIPERLQLKLKEMEDDLAKEAHWIFDIIIVELKYQQPDKFEDIRTKIYRVLKMFKKEKMDVPYINRYCRHSFIPELEAKDVWRIFNLDIDYGKLLEQKQKVLDFFNGLDDFAKASGEAEGFAHYKV